ncbi:MAG: hypothetical protein AB1898_13295 [Acidobacteriota bacterium]
MKLLTRVLLALVAIVLVAVPSSFLITILLLPLWSWVEASFGIESVGHSGPAEWCYALVFLVLMGALLLGVLSWWRFGAKDGEPG